MFNHVSVGTRDLARATRFYDAALGALGYRRTMSEDFGNAWGLELARVLGHARRRGRRGRRQRRPRRLHRPEPRRRSTPSTPPGSPTAAATPARRAMRDYTPDYYAAFLRDPDGNKLEAVHLPDVPFPER